MKFIFSRKGFDAENGGAANPVMPDGTMLSLPIPCNYDQSYKDMIYKGMSYESIIRDLKAKKCYSNCGHLDPDLRIDIHFEAPDNWKPIFGQTDAAQSHLENQGVTIGDVFLFFGWFRKTELKNGVLSYIKGTKDAHMLFGYLQIGQIVQGIDKEKFPWHPHSYRIGSNDTMYIASDKLIIDGNDTGLPGAGTFKYSDELVLTMPGMPKSRWNLPDFFREVNISCHSKDSWKPEGYFQTVRIGQEFVISEDPRVTEWAKNIIVNNISLTNGVNDRENIFINAGSIK